jgi:hypothetical protein
MAASDTALNQSLDALGGSLPGTPVNTLAFASLHTAAPSNAGSSEASGGGYARQACSWNNAATHAKTNSSSLSFSTAGSTAVTDAGTFSAASAGTFGIGIHLSSSVAATTITIAAGALSISGAAA